VHEIEDRPGNELLGRIAKGPLERQIDPLEVAAGSRDAHQVGRKIEQVLHPK
jgi:hypothetical protein